MIKRVTEKEKVLAGEVYSAIDPERDRGTDGDKRSSLRIQFPASVSATRSV